MSTDTGRRSVTGPDGRVIEFLVAGPADGLPLVLHEGTPCGLVLYPPTVRAAAVRGLRVILAARPGYEGSTPRFGRRVVDVAQDTAAVLDDLGADSFVTAGWSGGGPHALACAAALPGRCLAAASIAGVAPYQAPDGRRPEGVSPGLDWMAGMGPENVAEFGAALADQAVLTGEYADHVAACLRAALSSGTAGWRDDDLAFIAGWGFSLDGTPPLPAAIPGARVHLMPGDGHLSMTVSAFDRILDDLLDLAGLAA